MTPTRAEKFFGKWLRSHFRLLLKLLTRLSAPFTDSNELTRTYNDLNVLLPQLEYEMPNKAALLYLSFFSRK